MTSLSGQQAQNAFAIMTPEHYAVKSSCQFSQLVHPAQQHEANQADHSKYGMRPAAGLVHFGFTKMPELFPAVQQLQDMLCAGHNILAQTSNIYAALFALVYLQLGLIR